MHRNLLKILYLIIPSLTSELYSQQQATITGYVIDAENNVPIPYANVIIQETTLGAATDDKGFYKIENVPAGKYLLETKAIGYKNQIRGITLKRGQIVQLNFGLLPTVIELEEITVGAPLKDPMPTVKLESEDIMRLVPLTTADILREIPGVSTSRSGGWGTKPYFQGMTDSRLLVLLDGAKINQACPMGMDACTATLEPEMIENVEVQKGPGSALYGSGNLGGVIRISTISSKYANSPKFKTELKYSGKYKSVSNSRTGMLSISGGNDTFDFITSYGRGFHDDYQTKKGIVENSGFNSSNVHLKTRYRPDRNQQLLFTTEVYRANDIGWPASNTIIPKEKRETYALNYSISDVANHLQRVEFNFSYQPMYHNMKNYLPGEKQYLGNSNSNTINVGLRTYWQFRNKHSFTLGTDYSLWKMSAQRRTSDKNEQSPFITILPNSKLGELGVFLQDDFEISNRLKIQTGFRTNYIHSNARKDTTSIINQDIRQSTEIVFSGSMAMFYKLKDDIFFTTSISKGFKAATPVERFIAAPMLDGYYRVGNPDLLSEKNINERIGLRGMRNRFNWRFELYHNDLSNLISAEVDSGIANPYEGLKGMKRFVNINQANIIGGSAFLGIAITQSLFITSNISFDWGEDMTTGKPLPSIAPLKSNIKLSYNDSNKGYWWEFSIRFAANQNRYSQKYGEKYTPGYGVFNLRAGWEIKEGIELSIGVENIFNRYYRNHLNQAFLPEPGRNAYITVNLTLPDRVMFAVKHKKKELVKTEQITLLVEGMACQFCVNTVQERINALSGVVSTTVDLSKKTATVIIQEGRVSVSDVIRAVNRAGFNASLISIESNEKNTKVNHFNPKNH